MRICADCGDEFPERTGKGRPFTRCEECRTKPKVRSQARAVRESTCKDCGNPFSVDRSPDTKILRGPTRCESCRAARNRDRQRQWREANPDKWKALRDKDWAKRAADPDHLRKKREWETRRLYGLSPQELEDLLAAQGGVCAICRKPPRGRANGRARSARTPKLHVDHCHTTSRPGNAVVRGLLCGNCNTMIGLAAEDPQILLAAVEYLQREQVCQ